MKNMSKEELINELILEFRLKPYDYDKLSEKEKKYYTTKIENLKKIIDCFYDKNIQFISTLNEQEVDVFRKANGILSDGECYTLTDIAKLYNVSVGYIGEVFKRAKRKINQQILKNEIVYENKMLDNSISVLHLPQSITNTLFLKNINKIGDLIKLTRTDISNIRGISDNSCKVIEENLQAFGLHLALEKVIDYSELNQLTEEQKLSLTIDYLDFTDRSKKVLKTAGLISLKDIIKMSGDNLKTVRGLGDVVYNDIASKLKLIGIKLETTSENEEKNSVEEKLNILLTKKDKLEEEKKLLLSKIQLLQQKVLTLDLSIDEVKSEIEKYNNSKQK